MSSFNFWFTVLMAVIFATMVAIASQYPPEARFMPLLVGIPGLALCLLQILLDVSKARGGLGGYRFHKAPKAGRPADVASMEAVVSEEEFGPQTAKSEIVMWGYFLGFVAMLLAFGYYVAVPLMLVTFLKREAGKSWAFALILGIGASLTLYLVFASTLQIRLHPGFLTPTIMTALGF